MSHVEAHRILNLTCMRDFALKSHHYLVTAELNVEISESQEKKTHKRRDLKKLRDVEITNSFISLVEHEMQSFEDLNPNCVDPQIINETWKQAFDQASPILETNIILPKNRPWISDRRLEHIAKRNAARAERRDEEVIKLNKLIKSSVKEDRRQWFHEMLESGDWSAVQKFRKYKPTKCANLKDSSGNLLWSDE
eukprot:4425269-Karenia_brevis.AAC.1